MLQQKCCKQFQGLTLEQQTQLRDRVLKYIFVFSDTNKYNDQYENVRQQLCLALVFILIQKTEWDTSVKDCLETFRKPQVAFSLLTILRAWPEEIERWRIPCSSRVKRDAARVKCL